MSATPPQTPAVRAREIRVVQDDSPIAYLVDTARFEQTQRIATLMSHASLMPKHLGNGQEQRMANAFLIVGQSLRWGLDPFAVAPETYEVGGKLGFQGKLVAAVINARAGLSCPLEYHYNGKQGDEMACVVVGYEQKVEWTDDLETLLDAVADSDDAKAERRLARMGIKTVRITVAQAKTENKMWRTDPKQKLCYSGAVKWARRHRPEIILGVLTDEDMEAMEARLASAKTVVSVVPPRVATSFARSSAADLQQTALPEPAPKGAEEASATTPPAETPLPEATATAEPTEPKPAPGPERRTTTEEGVRNLSKENTSGSEPVDEFEQIREQIRTNMADSGITMAELSDYLKWKKFTTKATASVDAINAGRLKALLDSWSVIVTVVEGARENGGLK